MATPQQPQPPLPPPSGYYEDLDRFIRRGMIGIVQETVDAIVDHIFFVEQSGADRPWKDRSRISVRFRLQGSLGGTFSDSWSLVNMIPVGNGTVMRNTVHLQTRLRSGKTFNDRILNLCQDWERDATRALLDFLDNSRRKYTLLSKMRTQALEAAHIRGEVYTPEPIADPKLGACVAATRELRGISTSSRPRKDRKKSSPTSLTTTPVPADPSGPKDQKASDDTLDPTYTPLKNYSG